MTPVQASKKENEVTVFSNLYLDFERRPTAKFQIGDKVRIPKKMGSLRKATPQIGLRFSLYQKYNEPTQYFAK